MRQLSIFDRMAMSEAKADRLERLVIQQAHDLAVLAERVRVLDGTYSAPEVAGDLWPMAATPDAPLAPHIRSMAAIAASVASANGLTLAELRSNGRQRHIAWPRQDAMLEMVEAGFTTAAIGLFFDRDHTTVIAGAKAARLRKNAVNTCISGQNAVGLERAGERGKRSTSPDQHGTIGGFYMQADAAIIPESGQKSTPLVCEVR